jgi:WD40 repeat protein
VDVSPDGKHGLTGSRDDTIKVWDLESGKMLRTLEGHQGDVLRVKFHPTEFRAASGGADTNVLYWDLESGEHRRFPGHTSPITALDFSPDGYLVMSAATDQTARLIDFLSQKEVAKVERLGQVTAGAFSPDRRHALIGNIAGDLMWIDFGKERIVDSFSGHFKAVLTIDIADKNGLSVTGGMGGSVYVWGEFASRDHDRLEASFRHEDNVRQVAFTSHDPSILVTSGDDGMVKVWDVLAEIEDDSFGSP